MARITFKAKVAERQVVDGTQVRLAPVVRVPKLTSAHYSRDEFVRHPRLGAWVNSDMFGAMVARAATAAGVKPGADLPLDRLPPGVTADTKGYLAEVTFEV